jgi:hypothetical protein
MIPYETGPSHPIYMMAHGRLRVTQSSKHKTIYFLSSNPNSLFQILLYCLPSSWRRLEADLAGLPTLDQPRTLLPRWGPSREGDFWYNR